jgi:hypothetical protein
MTFSFITAVLQAENTARTNGQIDGNRAAPHANGKSDFKVEFLAYRRHELLIDR